MLKAFENRALKKIFGPETEEVEGDLGRLHNEHLLYLGFFPPWSYTNHSGCVFYSPLSGFSFLAYEVT